MAKIALVTGGTRGIGAAIAVALKQAGYQVAANYAGNDDVAKKFQQDYAIDVFKWDVANFEACQHGIADIEKKLGPVDVLINNAGIIRDGMLHRMSPKQWQDVMDTNLTSVFNMCRGVIEGMRSRNYGRIVNISSINGQKGQLGQVNYAAAKAGLLGFTKALALESAPKGITVNAIAPGYIGTEMVASIQQDILDKIVAQIPVGRLGGVQEIAAAVLYLVSDQAGFMTGATLSINGGQYMS